MAITRSLDVLIKSALREDVGPGDVTTDIFIPLGARFEGLMSAKADGVLAGAGVAKRVFELADPGARVMARVKDGAFVKKGSVILSVRGSRRMLTAERTALNFIQHLSGIATRAAMFAGAVRHPRTRIYDTRKTTPGLRKLEKYAVKCGGGRNHRIGLYDAFLIKDNHIAMLGGSIERLKERLARARSVYPGRKIEIEARTVAQVKDFLPLGFDIIMLDNMSAAAMKRAIALIRAAGSRTEIEISGGVTFGALASLSRLGADRISVGSLTNSAKALDIAFDVKTVRTGSEREKRSARARPRR